MKKHAKRVRADDSAGRVKNQALNRKADFKRQAIVAMETIEKSIAAAESVLGKASIFSIQRQVEILIRIGMDLPMNSPLPGGAEDKAKTETTAHAELACACHEAGDLLYMLAMPLSGLMEGTPGEGSGVQGLAEAAGMRLMACLNATYAENLKNGGER